MVIKFMKCENCFCIYQKNNKCILKNIELDVLGQCHECIYVDIPQKYLEALKNEKLNCLNG